MITRPPELHAFASWDGFLAAIREADDLEAKGPAATHIPDAFSEAPSAVKNADAGSTYVLPTLRLVAHPHTEPTLPSLLMRPFAENPPSAELNGKQVEFQRHSVLLAVGPEGGWIPPEIDLLQRKLGFLPFSLSDKILKCETALTACLTQLTMCYEDPMLFPFLRSPVEIYAARLARDDKDPERSSDAPESEHKISRHRGARDIIRLPGGFLMTFPQRYTTRTNAAEPQQQ
ncbi:RNA family related protein [Cyclospora cayetanensis]|nr:RNA family related protein [Cyclospora cayetanensis]